MTSDPDRDFGGAPTAAEDRGPSGSTGFDALLFANRARLLRFLESLGAGDMAEDIFHELWVNLRDRPTGPVGRPLSYLYRAAHNLMRDRYRSARQAQARDLEWYRATQPEAIDAATPWVERSTSAQQSLEAVAKALATIGTRAETCLRMHRIDGRSQKEVARALGVSLSTVEGDLRRGYAALIRAKADLDRTGGA